MQERLLLHILLFYCRADAGLDDFFHLGQYHRGYLLWVEFLCFSFELDTNLRLSLNSTLHFEWPMFHDTLDSNLLFIKIDQYFIYNDD